MWKYLVFWTVVTTYITAPESVPNEYGVTDSPNMVHAIAVLKSKSKDMTKEFNSREEALKFIDSCPYKSLGDYYSVGSYCIRFKMDSIYYEIPDSSIVTYVIGVVKPDTLKKGDEK